MLPTTNAIAADTRPGTAPTLAPAATAAPSVAGVGVFSGAAVAGVGVFSGEAAAGVGVASGGVVADVGVASEGQSYPLAATDEATPGYVIPVVRLPFQSLVPSLQTQQGSPSSYPFVLPSPSLSI